MQYKSLSIEAIKELAQQEFTRQSRSAHSVDFPKYVAVAGQPGAGKTAASQMVRDELKGRGGSIHLDTDIMREVLPLNGMRPPAQETQHDAGKIVDELRLLATENKLNIVEEGTFRDSKWVASLIDERKSKGYDVELMAVATPPQQSLSGVYVRYEAEHVHGIENPRLVPESFHKLSTDGFNETVKDNADKFDRARVATRSGEILFDSEKSNPYTTAIEALEKGQKPTSQQLESTYQTWQQALSGAIRRGANSNYIKVVEQHIIDIENQRKEQTFEKVSHNGLLRIEEDRLPYKQLDSNAPYIGSKMTVSDFSTAIKKIGGDGVGKIDLPKSGVEYCGKIIQVSDTHIVQKIGTHTAIAHDVQQLENGSALMKLASSGQLSGKMMDIKYDGQRGKGVISIVQSDKKSLVVTPKSSLIPPQALKR